MRLSIDKDQCACGSGYLIKDCCLQPDGMLRPTRWKFRLPKSSTGIEHPKCYAARLANCSSKKSGEHYISESVLKMLGEDGLVSVAGLAWQPENKTEKHPTARLTGYVLCNRHNVGLSGLDSIGIRFFSTLADINRAFVQGDHSKFEEAFLFNGHDVERWMLKTLCGVVASGNAATQTEKIRNWTPDSQWLKILFEDQPFPPGWGLYFIGKVGETSRIANEFTFSPLSNDQWGVYGAVITMNSRRFILSMRTPPKQKQRTILAHSIFRPAELVMTNGRATKIVIFGWDTPGEEKSVVINYEANEA